jgi:hypothetical protein
MHIKKFYTCVNKAILFSLIKQFIYSVVLSAFCFNVSTSAQIYNCDGKWTNIPCQGNIERTLEDAGYQGESNEENQKNDTVKKNQYDKEQNTEIRNSFPPGGAPLDIENEQHEDPLTSTNDEGDPLSFSMKLPKPRQKNKTNKKQSNDGEKEDASKNLKVSNAPPEEPLSIRFKEVERLKSVYLRAKKEKRTQFTEKEFDSLKRFCLNRAISFKDCEAAINRAIGRIESGV